MADLDIGLRIVKENTSQDLSVGPLDYTTSFNWDFVLVKATMHFTGTVSQDITMSTDSAAGSNYDTVVIAEKTSASTDYIFPPVSEGVVKRGDEIRFQVANVSSPAVTVYLEIVAVFQ